jgi:hypothetical protein
VKRGLAKGEESGGDGGEKEKDIMELSQWNPLILLLYASSKLRKKDFGSQAISCMKLVKNKEISATVIHYQVCNHGTLLLNLCVCVCVCVCVCAWVCVCVVSYHYCCHQ